MKFVTHLLRQRQFLWGVLLLLSLAAGLAVAGLRHRYQSLERVDLLQTEAQRSSVELMAQTLDGNLMGAISLLGLIDESIKAEAADQPLASPNVNLTVLRTLGLAYGAEGVFIVGKDGIVKSSWDRDNKPSTGLEVRFRPYYQTAMQGKTSVYAAVSMARGERALYFGVPIYDQSQSNSPVTGVLVARNTLTNVDKLLATKADGALLLSPQGVVFASSRTQWQGMVEGQLDAQRLQSIRQLKQFGAQFDKASPQVLPLLAQTGLQTLDGGSLAVATADVAWNDPAGHWTLLVLEDVSRTVHWMGSVLWGAGVSFALLVLAWMSVRLMQNRQVQQRANLKLQVYARQQESQAAFRQRLSALSLKLQRCRQVGELVQVFLQDSRELLGVIQGVVYLTDRQIPDLLHLAGSAACATPAPASLQMGQTLLGQCALERRPRVVATPGNGFWTVRSGLGQTSPAALVLMPMTLQASLIGVAEMALMVLPTEADLEKISEALAVLTSSVEILLSASAGGVVQSGLQETEETQA